MRCPYCGGSNPDQVDYCKICGRSIKPAGTPPSRSFTPQRPVYPPAQRPAYPPSPPTGAPRTTVQQPQRPVTPPPVATPQTTRTPPPTVPRPASRKGIQPDTSRWSLAAPPAIPPAPEPPAPFPPKTIAQLRELEQGALEYQLLSDNSGYGKKKIIRIQFRRCTHWQQVATLSKAFSTYDQAGYNTVIIQGVYNQERNVYEFNNGQLVFDRNVRLGNATLKRYQIETDNGFSSDALRIVLSE